jgi:hypothetical protein
MGQMMDDHIHNRNLRAQLEHLGAVPVTRAEAVLAQPNPRLVIHTTSGITLIRREGQDVNPRALFRAWENQPNPTQDVSGADPQW